MQFNPSKRIEGMDAFLHKMTQEKDSTYYDPWKHIDYNPASIIKNNKIVERAIWIDRSIAIPLVPTPLFGE